MIKVVHQIWIGPDPMPENYQEFRKRWQEMNPDWEFKLWTEKEIDAEVWDNQAIYDAVAIPPDGTKIHEVALATQRADIVRYEILYRYGGMYLDCDIEPIKTLSEMFEMYPESKTKASASYENTPYIGEPFSDGTFPRGLVVNNNFLWAPRKKMKIWKLCIEKLALSFDKSMLIPASTGPLVVSHVAYHNSSLVYIYPYNAFNYVQHNDIPFGEDAHFKQDELPDDVIAVHHYGHKKNGRPNTSWIY